MAERGLVSVIIPTYNYGSYVKEAVNSVCRQTYRNVEVIVVDDGSTDNTSQVMKTVSDPRVRYVRTDNKGNYYARNTGLALSKGEFIAFLDSDDVWVEDKLERQIQKFEENPQLGLCCSSFFVHFEGNTHIYADMSYSYAKKFDSNSGFVERVIFKNFVITSTLVIRRECVHKLGVFDTSWQNAMDYEFTLRIIFHYFALYMPDRLIVRREHRTNISKDKVNSLKSLIYIYGQCLSRFKAGKYFKPRHHDALISQALEETKYCLGLEYLHTGQFKLAKETLHSARLRRKTVFLWVARFAAFTHSKVLARWIDQYRTWRLEQSRIRLA